MNFVSNISYRPINDTHVSDMQTKLFIFSMLVFLLAVAFDAYSCEETGKMT